MKRVVVTGASGFIGRALCARLEHAGAEVLRVPSNAVAALHAMPEAVCVHLAANGDAQDVENRYAQRRDEATTLARQLLQKKFRRVIFASSAHVYGDAEQAPRSEESALLPTTAYGRLKAELEKLFSQAGHARARISNVYGVGMSVNNVFSRILRQLQSGDRAQVRNLASVRDYIHVDDVASALAALALGTPAGVFNISTGRGASVGELAALIARACGKPNARVEAEAELKSPSTLVLDPRLLFSACGWRARIRLEEGVAALAGMPAR